MTVFPWTALTPSLFDRPVRLTIGVFDGVHIGHQKLIEAIAEPLDDAMPLVITFRKSPALYFAPDTFPGFIMSYRQKLARLSSLGIGAVLAIDFSEEMSNLSGRAFIGLLKENLTIQKIVVGYNFRFGKSRNAGNDDLREMLSDTKTEVQVTEPVRWAGGIVSSSRVRTSIQEGRFGDVRAMLGQEYALDLGGCAVESTAEERVRVARRNIPQVLPRSGEYAVKCIGTNDARQGRCLIDDESVTLMAAAGPEITTVIFT